MLHKKNIILILFLVIFLASVFYYFSKQAKKNISSKTTDTQLEKSTAETWEYYYDDDYKYSVKYPSNLNVEVIHDKKMITSDSGDYYIINGGVSFSMYSMGVYGVLIFDTPAVSSLDEWVENENNLLKSEQIVIEEELFIGGNKAIITHTMGNEAPFEEYQNNKKIVFFNEDKLFVIYTTGSEYKKFLDTFELH